MGNDNFRVLRNDANHMPEIVECLKLAASNEQVHAVA